MKICSLTILHYGADYLPYALRSVYNFVDECHIFYTPTPSHGHKANIPPPQTESRDVLLKAAFAHNPDDKAVWYDTENLTQEGQHRDAALETVRRSGADLVIVLDTDEVWSEAALRQNIAYVKRAGGEYRNYLVNMVHFWRSFNYVCRDDGWPVRIIDLRNGARDTHYLPRNNGDVYHFGYAIRDEIMRYKWLIHGHKSELRPSWRRDKWFRWEPGIGDVHPTNAKGFWQPEPFNKVELPIFMRQHPFYNLDIIR